MADWSFRLGFSIAVYDEVPLLQMRRLLVGSASLHWEFCAIQSPLPNWMLLLVMGCHNRHAANTICATLRPRLLEVKGLWDNLSALSDSTSDRTDDWGGNLHIGQSG